MPLLYSFQFFCIYLGQAVDLVTVRLETRFLIVLLMCYLLQNLFSLCECCYPAQWMSLQKSHWHHNTDNLNAAFTFPWLKGLSVCAFVSQLSLIIAICCHSFCHFPKTPFRAFGGQKNKKRPFSSSTHRQLHKYVQTSASSSVLAQWLIYPILMCDIAMDESSREPAKYLS